jgi:short chain dehydrogenase
MLCGARYSSIAGIRVSSTQAHSIVVQYLPPLSIVFPVQSSRDFQSTVVVAPLTNASIICRFACVDIADRLAVWQCLQDRECNCGWRSVSKSKIVAITGASSGIGEATTLLLAERGAKIALARRPDRLEALVARIANAGGDATHLPRPRIRYKLCFAGPFVLAKMCRFCDHDICEGTACPVGSRATALEGNFEEVRRDYIGA